VSVSTPAAARRSRAPLVFLLLSVVLALGAGGYLYYQRTQGPARFTPEETVEEFLTSVFSVADPQRTSAIVCDGWDPDEAIAETNRVIADGARVVWSEVRVLSNDGQRATVHAALTMFLPRPSSPTQWRFGLVQENGWKVCEARPVVI